jgi:hypothetical protein
MKVAFGAGGNMLPARPLQTFISYSRVNQQFALRLACALKSAGFSIWMDQFDIPTGARWDDSIEKALQDCDIFLFIITPASIASENAKDEVGYAIDHGKHILPVLLEKCEIPLRLRRVQYVDFTQLSFSEGVETAKKLLSHLVAEINASRQNAANVAGVSAEQKHFTLARNEPKTTPTRKEFVPSNLQPRPGGRGKTFLKRIAIGGSIFLIAGIILAFFALKPSFLAAPPAPTSTSVPTENPPASQDSIPTIAADIPVVKVPLAITENFDSKAQWDKDWTLQLRHGNAKKLKGFAYEIASGEMAVKVSYEFVWAYFLYQPATSDSIEMQAVVADLNSVDTFGLVCQFGSQGWYEFDINGGGTFAVRYVDSMESSQDAAGYQIDYGSIPSFKDSFVTVRENSIRAICDGSHLSLFVNDQLVMDKVSEQFVLGEGQFGIAIRSYNQYPSRFAVKSISIRELED